MFNLHLVRLQPKYQRTWEAKSIQKQIDDYRNFQQCLMLQDHQAIHHVQQGAHLLSNQHLLGQMLLDYSTCYLLVLCPKYLNKSTSRSL